MIVSFLVLTIVSSIYAGITSGDITGALKKDLTHPYLYFTGEDKPEILETEDECSIQEGCLSVPGVYEDLVRPEKARVRYDDVVGMEHRFLADGMLARAILHEVDHLDGVLFVGRLSTVKRALLSKGSIA